MSPVADAVPTLDDLPLPRRVAVAELLTEIVGTERGLADLYGRFAAHATMPPLRSMLETLAREKRDQVERLQPLIMPLAAGVRAPLTTARDAREASGESRAEAFLYAFQRERALEVLYREIGALLAEAGPLPALSESAARAARHRTLLRELYLRYS